MRLNRRIPLAEFLALLAILHLFSAGAAHADWINLSGAENAPTTAAIDIENDHIRLLLEIAPEDLRIFHRLVPDALYPRKDPTRPPLKKRLQRFSAEDFRCIPDSGPPLQATLVRTETRMRRRLAPHQGGAAVDTRILTAELVYAFASPPQTLTVIPPVGRGGQAILALGFTARHLGVPIADFNYLEEAERIHLDWSDPWYSRFEDDALGRWMPAGASTFLYIEPGEVRHEILIRVNELKQWIELPLRKSSVIEAEEWRPLRNRIVEFLQTQATVVIDGNRPPPTLKRSGVVGFSPTRAAFVEQPGRLPLATAVIGVVFSYPIDRLPQEVVVGWNLYSDRIRNVTATVVDPSGPVSAALTPANPTLTWTNFLRDIKAPTVAAVAVDRRLTEMDVPLGSLACLGASLFAGWRLIRRRRNRRPAGVHLAAAVALLAAGVALYPYAQVPVHRPAAMSPPVADQEAISIFYAVLKNVYHSFDLDTKDDIHARLALSIRGDRLPDIYRLIQKSLDVEEAGGDHPKLTELKLNDVVVTAAPDRSRVLPFRSTWTAAVTVNHWGHHHRRKTQTTADISLEPVDGCWKITALNLREEKQIDAR